jgi:hypothetical protein
MARPWHLMQTVRDVFSLILLAQAITAVGRAHM